MMLRGNPFVRPLMKFNKIPFSFLYRNCFTCSSPPFAKCHYHLLAKPVATSNVHVNYFAVDKTRKLSMVAAAEKSAYNTSKSTKETPYKAWKKKHKGSLEGNFKYKLDMCSKHGNLVEALRLYDEAANSGVSLDKHHYNVLLYLCAREASGDGGELNELKELGLQRGFEIFQKMIRDKVCLSETTFTSMARLAAARDDPDMAFEMVKQMKHHGIIPRLRSYGPALFGFCQKGNAEKGYEVDAHMAKSHVMLEEPELSALLKVSVDRKKDDKVYEMLHRLRATVRQVPESTLQIIEDWFKSEDAAKVGAESWDVNKIKEGVVAGGGGWHGQGWLGSGRWRVVRTKMTDNGLCQSCGEKLVCIDIDPKETENFAARLTELACKREAKANFIQFQDSYSYLHIAVVTEIMANFEEELIQEWLQRHGPFDAVVDGANVGLINTHTFSFRQLNNVVNQLRQTSPLKRSPLVILHQGRVFGDLARNPNNRNLLESWKRAGTLYATPPGSNDDWYWLYAAVSCKCLLVTNDEMRDHLFQLLGTSFFSRWKEKHQVRLSMTELGLKLHMPPPYSIVIQESESGSWHVPSITDDDLSNPREWLCVSRNKNTS